MNGIAGKTNNYGGVMEGNFTKVPFGLTQDPRMKSMEELITILQHLLKELNQYSSSHDPQKVPYYTPWSAPFSYPDYYSSLPLHSLNRAYQLSSLLKEMKGQIQRLEHTITTRSFQTIQGTVQGLNHAARSLQLSLVLRQMESIMDDIYRMAYEQKQGTQ